jgi:hypothetical protein
LDNDIPESNLTRDIGIIQYLFQQKDLEIVSKYNLKNPFSFFLAAAVNEEWFEGSVIKALKDFWTVPGGVGFVVACNSGLRHHLQICESDHNNRE